MEQPPGFVTQGESSLVCRLCLPKTVFLSLVCPIYLRDTGVWYIRPLCFLSSYISG